MQVEVSTDNHVEGSRKRQALCDGGLPRESPQRYRRAFGQPQGTHIHEAKLYEGKRYGLDPVELPTVPSTIEEALGEELTEQHLTVASYGAGAARAAGGGVTPSIQRLAKMVEAYQMARSRDLGSDDVARIAEAATAGRVGTLLIEADRQIPGRIDPATGQIHAGDIADPEVDDVLDDLAEHVLRIKGDVVLVPAERMPSTTGAAAIYRY